MSKVRKSLAVLSSAIAPVVFYSSAFAGVTPTTQPSPAQWPTNASFGGSLVLSSGTSTFAGSPAVATGGGPTVTNGPGPITFAPNQTSNQYAQQVLGETFLTPATGFTLGAFDVIQGGGGDAAAPNTVSIHLFQLNTTSYNSSSNNSVGGYYTLGNGGAEVGNDLLGGGNGETISLPGANNATTITEFDFTGSDRIALLPNTEYALELWNTGTPNPAYFFTSTTQTYTSGEVMGRGSTSSATIASLEMDHSAQYRSQVLGSSANLLFAVYNANVPGPTFWDSTSSGSWDSSSTWSSGTVPNAIGAEADFLSPVSTFANSGTSGTPPVAYTRTDNGLTASGNVYTDTAKTVGYMNFDNSSASYVIDGAGSLTLQATTPAAQINVFNGTQEINLPLTIASNTTFTVSSGATLNISDPMFISSGVTLTNNGGAGTVAYQSIVTVQGSGNITLAAPTVMHALVLSGSTSTATVSPHGASVNVLQLDSISTVTGSSLNINNNAIILHGGPVLSAASQLATAFTELQNGFNRGAWNGTGNGGSILSTTAANDTTHLTTLGFMQSQGGTFDGITTSTNDVIIKYTYYGDANLDGTVNGADYMQIDNGFGQHLTGWQNGDFNYDGVVDGSDYSLIDNTYNQINATGAAPLAILSSSSADLTPATTGVPEPTTLGLLGIGALSLFTRRRRRNSLLAFSLAVAPLQLLSSSAHAGVTLNLEDVGALPAEWPTSNLGTSPQVDSGTSTAPIPGGPGNGTNPASTLAAGTVLSETFTATHTFNLGAISFVVGGGGNDTTDDTYIGLYQLSSAYTPTSAGYTLGGAGGVEVGNELLGGGAPLAFNVHANNNAIYEFDFNNTGTNDQQVELQAGDQYAIEVFSGANGNAPTSYWQNAGGISYSGGQAYSATNVLEDPPSDHDTNPRSQAYTTPENMLFAVYPSALSPGPTFWSQTTSGNWNTATNWSSQAVPNAPGAEADFLSSTSNVGAPIAKNGLTSNGNVYTDTAETVGIMNFDNSNTYVIDGAGSLTLQASSGNAVVNVLSGTQEINVPLTIASSTVLTVSSGAVLNINDPVTVDTGKTLSKSGAGTVKYNSTITVQSGGFITFASPTQVTSLALTDSADASVTNHGSSPVNLVQLNSLTTGTGSQFDLTNNALVLHGGLIPVAIQLSSTATALKNGFNNGNWNGTNGIVSSTAAADSTHLTTLGYMQSQGGNFDGVTTTTSDVLVKYTYYGDANLDGTVNGSDYQQIDNGFGQHLTGWQNGDFNYDGVVDGSDYSLIDNTFNQLSATGAAPLAILGTASADLSSATTGVPEPATLGLLGIGALSLLGRRRRSI